MKKSVDERAHWVLTAAVGFPGYVVTAALPAPAHAPWRTLLSIDVDACVDTRHAHVVADEYIHFVLVDWPLDGAWRVGDRGVLRGLHIEPDIAKRVGCRIGPVN